MMRDPPTLAQPLPPTDLQLPSFRSSSPSQSPSSSTLPSRRLPSERAVTAKSRPRSGSRNDLFSMDWGTGSVTPPKADSNFIVNRRELGVGEGGGGGYGERYRITSAGARLQRVAGGSKETGMAPKLETPVKANMVQQMSPVALEESPTIATAISTSTSPPIHHEMLGRMPPLPNNTTIPTSPPTPHYAAQGIPHLQLRMNTNSKRTRLGEGRYASVYAGRFRSADTVNMAQQSGKAQTDENGMSATGWRICAVKGFAGDEDGWEMAVREKEVLGRANGEYRGLGEGEGEADIGGSGRQHIVGLFGLVEEGAVEQEEDLDELLEMAGLSYTVSVNASPAVSRHGSLKTNRAGGGAGILEPNYSGSLGRLAGRRVSIELNSKIDEFGVVPPQSPPSFNLNLANALLSPTSPRSPHQPRYTMPRPLLLLEYLPGGTMERVIKQTPKTINGDVWRKWLRQGLEALTWLQEQDIVHCDIKPANILLDHDYNIRLADFSSALIVDPDHPPHDGVGRGTTAYSSPEILDPCIETTFSSPADLFSLGVTLYSCLTGLEPYKGLRTVELMWNVRKGRFWEWEERARIERVGFAPISPTTALKQEMRGLMADGVRRTGSLKETHVDVTKRQARPRLPRMGSSELLDGPPASEPPSLHSTAPDDPGGGVSLQLRPPISNFGLRRQKSSLQLDTSAINRAETCYKDGVPLMAFLSGHDAANEQERGVLRILLDPEPARRTEAKRLLAILRADGADDSRYFL